MTWLEHEASASRPARSHDGERRGGELAIGGERGGARALARREARRVGDHDVPAAPGGACAGEEVERVLGGELVAGPVQLRHDEIAAQLLDRRERDVDGGHTRSAAERGVDREPAGVGEQVEHGRAGREPADGAAVVALVEEEPGLLSGADVDAEPRVVLRDRELHRGLAEHRLAGAAAALPQPRVFDGRPAVLEAGEHRREQRPPQRARRRTVEHGHRGPGVRVDDESGQPVGFAMDEADAGAAGQQWVALAPSGRGACPPRRPRVVDRGIRVAIEHARADRRLRVDERAGERATVVGDRHDLARGGVAAGQRAVVDPRMAGGDRIAQRLDKREPPPGHPG